MRKCVVLMMGVALSLGAGAAPGEPAVTAGGLMDNLSAGRKQTIVAYGTSLTAQGAWVRHLQAALDRQYPGLATITNTARSGMWSKWGVDNLDQRVIANRPDAVFVEFGVNDAVARFSCPPALARTNLEAMVDRILAAAPACQIILMTMTPGDGYPKGHFSYRDNVAAYYQVYRDVAKARGLLLVDNYSAWTALQASDPALFRRYVPDSVHANEAGCREVVTPAILRALGLAAGPGVAVDGPAGR
jgi:acyl-CoA thioesterase-1